MIPRATYRLQLHKDFGFDALAACAPYLAALGVSHGYLSPYLKARPGSAHGYDIVDHAQLNPELGDEAAFRRMSESMKSHALGHILDFVPNHMGVGGADNPLWLDVLEWGADAAHAGWFDIEWDTQRRYLHNKVLVPLLGDQYGIELERGALELKFDPTDGSFAVWAYGTHKLPITPPHYARILGSEHAELERLADTFAWLPNWRLQMARRAAEFKTQLAALVDAQADAREALYSRLTRFQGRAGEGAGWRELDALIQRQHWRVAYFRVAADDINYRRFFNINDLAGLRIELPEVFDHAHQRVLRLIKDGTIDGLRIDHIDGLLDPKAYLSRLQRRIAARRGSGHFYLVAEKILAAHETLREDWQVDGTTGYDFLNQLTALLIDPSAEAAFTDCYRHFTGEQRSYAQIGRVCKLHIMDNEMSGELNVLARDMARLARQNPRTADFTQTLLRRAIKELIACFPVYRTYMDSSAMLDGADQRDLDWALAQARRNETAIDPSVFSFLEQVLTARLIQRPHSGFSHVSLLHCATRLQQYSGPVAAKGLEDTAFYRYNRFIALNEVGGDPSRFGSTLAAFHRANQQRAQRWPHSMLATATHDTKRGEDARARLAALSEFPEEWARHVSVWARILRGPNAQLGAGDAALQPDRNDEYFLYQLLLGSWPSELLDEQQCESAALGAYAERVQQTMLKSMREARVHTSWAFPNAPYEEAMKALIESGLTGSRASAFMTAFLPFARQVANAGMHNSLIQTVVKLTAPGVPDLYNGGELWDLCMVDPDNRRPVDYALRERQLREIDTALRTDRSAAVRQLMLDWRDGRIKLAVIAILLRHRAEQPDLYASGDYQPLPASGPRAEEIGAYLRTRGDRRLIVALARYTHRREADGFDEQTHVPIPDALAGGPWRELLSGLTLAAASRLEPRALFSHLPVAVLVSP
ncbi:MAG TPA: malto-oligosyltrehalose synthase [Steroidobacteraceae bacterium]|nr:malto-oligosyltrehalose synthase [Steroidobacteraceae bacterium]